MNITTTTAPETFRNVREGAQTIFAIFDDMGDLAAHAGQHVIFSSSNWRGNIDSVEAIEACRNGDLSRVAKSDALLAKMEAHALPTARRAWRDDVCGSIPNVPAFVAGHPLAMRRRVRGESESAPLAIIADLTSSAGVSTRDVETRGAAILALVRALAARRPVELWVCAGLGWRGNHAAFAVVRIETAPLDLARAAFAITHPAMSRGLLYKTLQKTPEIRSEGTWPFQLGGPLTRAEMECVFAPVMTHVTETLCLPGIHKDDESVTDPEAWIARQLAEHAPVTLEN